MINVTTTENIKKSENLMFKNKITQKELMKKAGIGCVKNFDFNGNIAIVLGTGNNAGDGYVIAYELYKQNKNVDLILIKEKFSECSKYYFEICKKNNIRIINYKKNIDLSEYDIIADCIFGIGVRENIDELFNFAIDSINKSKIKNKKIKIVSIDINSGLNSDTGIGKNIVKSDMTLSIGVYKTGHFLNMAKDYIKNKKNIDIDIDLIDDCFKLIEFKDIITMFNKRKNFSNKGSFGKICLIGGSNSYVGAIKLSNLSISSLKSGAGLVTVAVPSYLKEAMRKNILESTLYLIKSIDNEIKFDKKNIDELINKYDVICCGMGIGRSIEAEKIIFYIIENFSGKLVIDADALFLISKNLNILNKTKSKIILTPHLKEFEKLYNSHRKILNDKKIYTINDIINNQIYYIKEFVNNYNVVVLLKGPSSLIADKKNISIVDRGISGMATAGSGDVLSGVLSGILGYIDNVYNATIAACYINGLAGEFASNEFSNFSMTASDTIKFIPKVFKLIEDSINE